MTHTTIIGGGLSAHLILLALLKEGRMDPAHITWIRPNYHAASSAPGALLHAFPGRSLEPTQLGMLAFKEASAHIESTLHKPSGASHALRTCILRPILPGALGKRYMDSYTRGQSKLPKSFHHEILEQAKLRIFAPSLDPSITSAIRYSPAYSVHMPSLLKLHRQQIARSGIAIIHAHAHSMHTDTRHSGRWIIDAGLERVESENVVLTVGASLPKWFPHLNMQINGGELMVLKPEREEPKLKVAISGGGHIAPLVHGHLVVGATYLRHHTHNLNRAPQTWRTNEEAIKTQEDLLSLISRFFPSIKNATPLHMWAQRRLVYATDRMPLAGPVPGHSGLYVLGALGSKGLLFAPLLARALTQHMMYGHDLPIHTDTRRTKGWEHMNKAPTMFEDELDV